MPIGDVTTGTSKSGQVYFSGIGSGTDFDTMINKLVQVEQSRVNTYKIWQKSWQDKNVAFKDLNSKMLTLRTTLQGMDTIGKFLKKSATASDSNAVTAVAAGEAENGTHTYSVRQLAKNKIMVTGSGYATLTEDINPSAAGASFTYTYKGITVSNAIPPTATLNDLVNIINTNGANKGVRASTIYDGTRYYLQLRGLDTGSNASLTISPSSTLSNFSAANFQTIQNNQDLKLKVDGWPLSNAYISKATNTISDVIPGITLTVKSSGAGTLTVQTDADAVVENVQTFISQINDVRKQIKDLTKFDPTTKKASILTGNYGLQLIGTILNNVTAAQAVGFNGAVDSYISLASVGLNTDAKEGSLTQGQIILDETTLRNVLASNALAVGKLFAANAIGSTSNANITYSSSIPGITKPGEYAVSYTVAGGKITGATINGHAANFSSNGSTITGMSGRAEAGLMITVNNLADGNYAHKVFLHQGKNPELVGELGDLTNVDTGPLNILQKNYVTISDGIQKKIDSENRRISLMEKHLRDKFAKLDTLLGKYSKIQTQLGSQIAQLNAK